eukprot:TRINITY_DN40694_c0_g1_i1.p1 TRINITY_DN40694_c0_g1~~TRINITY_DN40694_c0_g1_i1.p1  ORF type:complete len:561 (-),score=90.59 TRINITY_DN40694_c0_g1_i1:69-1688(-)
MDVWHGMSGELHEALAAAAFAAEPSLEENLCHAREIPMRILDGLNSLVAPAFRDPEDAVAASATRHEELLTLAEDIEHLDVFARRFGFRPGSGKIGWHRLWRPLQGCPVLFIAMEIATGLRIWLPSGRVGVNFDVEGHSSPRESSQKTQHVQMGRVEPDWMPIDGSGRRSLRIHSQTSALHFARALRLAAMWRSWREFGGGEQEIGDEAKYLCSMTRRRWGELNSLASLVLHGANCALPGFEGVTFTDLLGCNSKAPTVASLCKPPELPPLRPGTAFEAFWDVFSGALLRWPVLSLPLGFREREEPHLMRTLFPDLVLPLGAKLPPSTGSEPEWLYLELGVFNASSTNFIARSLREASATIGRRTPVVYGFDSFEGLPDDWRTGPVGRTFWPRGSFRVENLPEVEENVRLIQGWFNETLPAFVRNKLAVASAERRSSPQARLVHIDCDLFDSTMEALRALSPLLGRGTVLVFDEIVNHRGFFDGELRALYQFLLEQPRPVRLIYAPWHVAQSEQEILDLDSTGVREWSMWQAVAIELLA